MASWVYTLSRDTGWDPDYIIWQLPLSLFLQFRHCALRAADEWTVPPTRVKLDSLDRLAGFFDSSEDDE